MNWNKISIKITLIQAVKRTIKRIEREKILNSVLYFVTRMDLFESGEYIC